MQPFGSSFASYPAPQSKPSLVYSQQSDLSKPTSKGSFVSVSSEAGDQNLQYGLAVRVKPHSQSSKSLTPISPAPGAMGGAPAPHTSGPTPHASGPSTGGPSYSSYFEKGGSYTPLYSESKPVIFAQGLVPINYTPSITSHTVIHQIHASIQPGLSSDLGFGVGLAEGRAAEARRGQEKRRFHSMQSMRIIQNKGKHSFGGELKDEKVVMLNGIGTYKGQVSRNAFNGIGQISDIDGRVVYQGHFVENEYEGQGKMFNLALKPNSDKEFKGLALESLSDLWESYEGEFKRSKFDGIGRLKFVNGCWFLGEFREGKANGFGVFSSRPGKRFVGVWRDDKLVEHLE